MDTQNTQEVLDALSFLGYNGISAYAPDPKEDYIISVEVKTDMMPMPLLLDISGPEIERLAKDWRLIKSTNADADEYQVELSSTVNNTPRNHE